MQSQQNYFSSYARGQGSTSGGQQSSIPTTASRNYSPGQSVPPISSDRRATGFNPSKDYEI